MPVPQTKQQVRSDFAHLEDAEQILSLNMQEYGPKDILATPDDFIWRFEEPPAGSAIVPVIRNEADEVVGCIWIVPLDMRINHQDILGATGTNLVIAPEYRDGFGYIKLMRSFNRAFRKHNILLHYSFIAEDKYQQMQEAKGRKNNWRRFFTFSKPQIKKIVAPKREQAWTIPFLAKPINLDKFVDPYVPHALKRFIRQNRSRSAPERVRSPNGVDVQCHVVEQFDASFDQFWENVQDKYPAMLKRDRAFLNWRFKALSGRQYKTLAAYNTGRMLGYIVLRCVPIREIETGLITDFLVEDSALGAQAGISLLAQAEDFFRRQQVALSAAILSPDTEEYQLLNKVGYRNIPDVVTPRPFRFATFSHASKQTDFILPSPQGWFITFADYESF